MNIVLVNHYAGSPAHGMEFRPHQMARHWTAAGHDVTILAGSYSHLRNRNPEITGRVGEETIDGIRYRWLRTPVYQGNGLGRIRSIHAFIRAVDRERRTFLAGRDVDVVVASSTYPFDIDPCRRIAREHDATLVWEVHDLWPLSPMQLSGYSPRHPFIRVTQRAEDRCCRDADVVVSMLPHAIEHLSTRGLDPDRCVHIPNGASPPGPAGPGEDTAARMVSRLRSEGRFVLVHAGGLGSYHGIDTLIDATANLAPELSVVLVGDGPDRTELERRAGDRVGRDVHFLGRTTRAGAVAAMAVASASYAGLRRNAIYRFGISLNKIYDGMLAARPIVGSYTAGNDPIREAGCGISVDADDPPALAAAIDSLRRRSADDLDALGMAGALHVSRHHDHAVLAGRFLEAIESHRNASPGGGST